MTNIKYFTNVSTIEELKKEYRKLAKKYHPDLNENDTSKIMIEINNEYEYLFDKLKDSKTEKQGHTNSGSYRNIIDALVKFDSINIDIIGSWVWVFGDYNTMKAIKEELKQFGFKWSASNKKWYWTETEMKGKKRAISYDKKIELYGKESVKTAKESKRLA